MLEGAAESPWLCQFTEVFASLLPDSSKRHDFRQYLCLFLFFRFSQYLLYNMDPKFVAILEILQRTSKQQEQKKEELPSEISQLL